MKSGYDQFFKKARENAKPGAPKQPHKKAARFEMPERPASASLAQQLRTRTQEKKKRAQRKGIPWKLVGISFLGLVVAAAGVFEHERVEKFVKKIEISMIGSAVAESKPAVSEKPEAKTEEKKTEEVSKKTSFTEEELNHFAKLNERKRELDAREEELNRLEAEIQTQKQALEERMQSLDKTRRDISSVLEERVKTDEKKVETLVQMYSNMKPQQAAKIFEEMDEDLAVDIIGRMKKKNAAEIMNLIKPEKAKVFAEKFAGYKRN